MSDNQYHEEPEEEIMYAGNSVPKVLRWIYTIFILWGISYFIKWSLPDLKAWLDKL